jgi:hypothetical protein
VSNQVEGPEGGTSLLILIDSCELDLIAFPLSPAEDYFLRRGESLDSPLHPLRNLQLIRAPTL